MSIKITIPATELYDEEKEEFIYIKKQDILLEHSLVSVQKWEQKWQIPFLNREKTPEQIIDYLRFMTITQNVPDDIYNYIPASEMTRIRDYMESPMTATTINNPEKKKKGEIITAEIIYYWMIKLGIPAEYRKWHLNSLLTLIEVVSLKETPEKKMSAGAALKMQRDLNAARRAKYHSKG